MLFCQYFVNRKLQIQLTCKYNWRTNTQIKRTWSNFSNQEKGRWSCVNVSCFLHNVKCWDGRKDFYEHLNKMALAKLLWSDAACWWILLAERMWQKLFPCLFSRAESVGRAWQYLIQPKLPFLALFQKVFNSTEVEEYKKGKADRQQVQHLC